MVRAKGNKLFGHASIKTQLAWCKKEKVLRMIITHCGTQIVARNQKKVEEKIKLLTKQYGIHTTIATDGMVLRIR